MYSLAATSASWASPSDAEVVRSVHAKRSTVLVMGFLVAALLPGVHAADGCDPLLRDAAASGIGLVSFQVTIDHVGDGCEALLNHAPLLLGAWTDPEVGVAYFGFGLHVTYVDADGGLPASIEAKVDERAPIPMTRSDPGDVDSRDGIAYRALLAPDPDDPFDSIPAGLRSTRFTASDGLSSVSVTIAGPRVIDLYSASVRLPNPTDRLLIHPIANGPTLVPPVEVLPPLGQLPGSPANGVTSYAFEIEPSLAHGDSPFTVGEAFVLDLPAGSLEHGGVALEGAASLSSDAHAGTRSVQLLDGAGNGAATLLATPDHALSQMGAAGAFLRAAEGSQATTEMQLLLSLDLDDVADACLAGSVGPLGVDWSESLLTPSSPVELRVPDCLADPVASGTLAELQAQPHVGLADIVGLRLQATSGLPGDAVWADDASLQPILPFVNVDFDACFYGAGADLSPGSFQPLSCVSDIGPNSGLVPEGTRVVNVWADTLVPNPLFAVPSRLYVEPTSFGFYVERPGSAPTVSLPVPEADATLRAVFDVDSDGVADPGEPVVLERTLSAARSPQVASGSWDMSGLADGQHSLLLSYEDSSGESTLSLLVDRFINDAPLSAISAVRDHGAKRILFLPSGSDPDDAQGAFAALRGGLASWRIAFGDGSEASGPVPVPDCVSHRYASKGIYDVVFEVADQAGATSESRIRVDVPGDESGDCR